MDIEVIDGKVVITIDAATNEGPSASGKTCRVASTGGFTSIAGKDMPKGFKLNLNATIPNPEYTATPKA